jgi:electron transport complex protein RnfG
MIGIEKGTKKTMYNVYEARYPDGNLAGWVTKAAGQGYADKIELLVGLEPSAQALTGIFVLDQKETPGLGNKIIEDDWRSQFKGKDTGREFVVVKGGAKAPHEIDALTGATISSRSVSDIVNATVNDLRGSLAAQKTPGAAKDN